MSYRYLVVSITLVVFILVLSCDRNGVDTKGHDYSPIQFFEECQEFDFTIQSLDYAQLPHTYQNLSPLKSTDLLTDSEGVVMLDWKGKKYYQPVDICRRSTLLLDAIHRGHETADLPLLLAHVNRLLTEATEIDGALYYPYKMHYDVHLNENWELNPPWYSGMAQGQVLLVLTRTFLTTGDSTYLEAAHKTFTSLTRLRDSSDPWVCFIDSRGCYWIEEYPTDETTKTLNGFIFAIYGVYDYYQLTNSSDALEVLTSSLSTIKNYIPYFRRPGEVSFYDLVYRHYAANYHHTHIKQLRQLELMTADSYFGDWADSLYADYSQ